MIYIKFQIKNPWHSNKFKNIWMTGGYLTKNKSFELELYQDSEAFLAFAVDMSLIGKDHAGFELNIGLFGYRFSTMIYDTRHWDYKNGKWE
jgi:hypothetical protein